MPSGNIFGAPLRETIDFFSDFIQGTSGGYALYLSQSHPTDAAFTAVDNSLAALGYGKGACCFAAISVDGINLDPDAVRTLIEGLDPVILIAADAQANAVLSQAYRASITANAPLRLMGRSGVTFENFEQMISTPDGKQRAWALLKTLPKKN